MSAIPDFSLDLAEFFVDFPTEGQVQPPEERFSVVNEETLEELREKSHNKNTLKSGAFPGVLRIKGAKL